MTFPALGRPVIDEDVVKAIKYKLNNEEQGWKKQTDSLSKVQLEKPAESTDEV